MKILFDSYNNCCQNKAGGVQNKIMDLYKCLISKSYNVSLFNKWEHNLEDYDILHLFKMSFEYWSLIQYAKSKGKKIILSAIIPLSGRLKIKLDLFLCHLTHLHSANYFTKKIFDAVDVIVTETDKERSFIIKTFSINQKKIVVIPNGVSLDFTTTDKNLFCEEYGVREGFVLQVGRIDRNKNLLSVIKALKGTGIELVVIGGPAPDEIDYYENCKAQSDNHVHYVGWIKHNDPLLVSALKSAKVLVLPSHKEIFGNAIFEGVMAGCNIVLTNELPYKEWGMEGYVYPIDPDNISDIRTKILTAYDAPMNGDFINEITQNYSIDSVADAHIDLYEKILKSDKMLF